MDVRSAAEADYLATATPEQQAAYDNATDAQKQNLLLKTSPEYAAAYSAAQDWGIGGDYSRALNAVTTALRTGSGSLPSIGKVRAGPIS